MTTPSVGRIVHYQSGGEYPPVCRAAIITEVDDPVTYPAWVGSEPQEVDDFQTVGLCVLNPEGMYFSRGVPYREDPAGGTWHWPERV